MNDNKPTVSVIVPTYNRAHLVGRAIQSVLNQTYQDFEVIVVDDGSTDNTKEIIEDFQKQNKNIIYIKHEKNKGGSAARNTGYRAAKGKYIAFLDSDDEWLAEKMALQIDVFKNGSDNLGVVYCDVMVSNNDKEIVDFHHIFSRCRGYIYNSALEKCGLVPCSVLLVKRECFQRIGLFNEQLSACQDDDICIRLAKCYEFDLVPKPLVVFHVHKGLRISNDFYRVAQAYVDLIQTYKDEIIYHCGNKALSGCYSKIGRHFLDAREFKQAREIFLESIRIYPFLVYPLFYWGLSFLPSVFILLKAIKCRVYKL